MPRIHKKHPIRRRILLGLAALCVVLLGIFLWRDLVPGRTSSRTSGTAARVELSWEEALADGVLTEEEIAIHYAPEIDAAVNTVISSGGRGDFLAAVDYDGNWAGTDNWENIDKYALNAVVYWTVQETETHWFVGYYFFHPRDDSEIWLDKHENDLEGIMLAIRKQDGAFGQPELMYTQGHGGVPFFYDEDWAVTEKSHRDGGLLLDGDRPVVYITPNGTLDYAGHSVESGKDHSTYLYVGNSGVHYYHGGVAEEPATYKGDYANNRCSYALESLQSVYDRRNGPYGDSETFGNYGAFRGENYETDAANPPWGWRNKTAFGLSGTFLSDPAWTVARALTGLTDFSETYVNNHWADWKLTLTPVAGAARMELLKDGSVVSTDAWFTLNADGCMTFTGTDRETLWAAGPRETVWQLIAYDKDGNVIDAEWTAEYEGE